MLENAAGPRPGCRDHLDVQPGLRGHFNQVVSFADAAFGGLSWRDAAA